MIITPHQFNRLRKQKPNLVPQIPAQAYRCGSPSSASAASFCQSKYSSFPLSCFRQTIHPEQSSVGELTASPHPLSQTLADTLMCFGFNSISTARSCRSYTAEQRHTGFPGRQVMWHRRLPEAFPLWFFLTAYRKSTVKDCQNSFTKRFTLV